MQHETINGAPPPGVIASDYACLRCGRSLRGVRVDDGCPECAHPAAMSLPPENVAALSRGSGVATVGADRPCAGCGYSLRGLSVEGVCPECGTPVRLSLRGTLLRYGSPAHLAVLHRGAFLVELSIMLLVVGAATMIVVGMLLGSGFFGASISLPAGVGELVGGGLWLIVSIMALVGWWLISTPDPAVPPGMPGSRPRRVLRVGVAVQFVGSLLSFAFEAAQTAIPPTSAGAVAVAITGGAIELASMVAWAVSFFAAMAYIRHLAGRVPDSELASRAKTMATLGWIVVGGWALLIGLMAAVAMAGRAAPIIGPVVGVSACIGIPLLGVTSFIALIVYIVLIDRFRVVLKRERTASELERAAGPGPGAGAAAAP